MSRKRLGWLMFAIIAIVLFWTMPFWYAYTRVSPLTLRQLPQRMALVKSGMTEQQVWQTLGIPQQPFLFMEGEGPLSGHWEGYRLPYGYSILLVMDDTQRPPIFKRGSVTRTLWP